MQLRTLNEAISQINLLEDAIGSCKCGVTIADALDPKMPLIYINGTFCEITGYSVDEVIGRNCRFLQGEHPNMEARAQIRDALDNGKHLTVLLKNFRKDGEPFWNELNLSPIERNGKVTHFVGIQQDVTERVETKKALEQEIDKKNHLLGMAAHDLRNPLALIKSFSELARGTEGKESQEMLRMIEEVSDKAMNLVNDILDFSAIQGGTIDLEIEKTDLNTYLDRFEKIARQMTHLKNISFELIRDLEIGDVHIDPDRIEQVLDNLLTNAIKFSHRNTCITLKVQTKDASLTFEVIDQGQGIPKEELPKLFKEFKSTRVRPTEDESSSGLGLAITKRLVELHDGKIEVDSEEGKGSTFRVKIPLNND